MSGRGGYPGIAAIVVVCALALAAPAAAAERTVCPSGCDFSTVQAAVDAADPGDTISVGEGTYVGRVTIDKLLTLTGSGQSTVLEAPGPASPPGAPVLTISAQGKVTVQDLKVDASGAEYGVLVEGDGIGLDLFDSTVTGYASTGIRVNGTSSAFVQDVAVHGLGAAATVTQTGIAFVGGAGGIVSSSEVSENRCSAPGCGPDPVSAARGTGVLLDHAADVDVGANDIHDNDVGVRDLPQFEPTPSFVGHSVYGNEFRDNRYSGIEATNPRGTSVRDNTVTGGGAGLVLVAREGSDPVSVSAVHNSFASDDFGVDIVEDGESAPTPDVELSLNRIVDNQAAAIRNLTDAEVDAVRNWFGCNGGPGAPGCGSVVAPLGPVDFDPWVVLSMSAAADQAETDSQVSLDAGLRRDSTGACLFDPNFKDPCPEFDFGSGASPVYSTTLGSISALPYFLALETGTVPGTAVVSASLDGETVSDEVEVVARPVPAFDVDSVSRDRRHGTARVSVSAGDDGRVTLRGEGVRPREVSVTAGEPAELVVRTRGRVARRLDRKGKAVVTCEFAYTSRVDETETRTRTITLIRRG